MAKHKPHSAYYRPEAAKNHHDGKAKLKR